MDQNRSLGTERAASKMPSKDKVKADVSEVVDKAKSIGREQVESGKQAAASQTEKVVNVIEQAASQLRDSNLRTLADYTSEIGSSIKSFSDGLQNRSVDELVSDIRDMARRNPTAFILGSVVLGIGISRFFKASAERRQQPNSENRVSRIEEDYVGEYE